MIFLIEYDRSAGLIKRFEGFDVNEKELAQQSRTKLELERNKQNVRTEIVLLEAANEDDLRKTHARYFEDVQELINSFKQQVENLQV